MTARPESARPESARPESLSLESRIRRLEDRAQISETVIRYAMGVDQRDWAMFGNCFTDPVHVEFGLSGLVADLGRDELVSLVRGAIGGFTATQHLSPNHVIDFSDTDPDRARCHSYMYAQHYLEGSAAGDFYLARGSYASDLLRAPDGWRIERLIQRASWAEGNTGAVAESADRYQAGQARPGR
jgi:SnoaL-like domain